MTLFWDVGKCETFTVCFVLDTLKHMAGKNHPPTRLDIELVKILQDRANVLGLAAYRTLATKSGVTKSTIQRAFTGERTLRIAELEAICNALGLTLWQVMKEATERANTQD